MLLTITIILRILSNSLSNVYQKKLVGAGYNATFINFVMYLGLSACVVPIILRINWLEFDSSIWFFAILGGLFGALGNSYLVKALKNGELSVLGPINAYKSVVAAILGVFIAGEIPSVFGIFAIGLIVFGSYFIFDTQAEGFSISLLKRSDIRYRIYALVFTAIEALCIKNVITDSNIVVSFLLWCIFGMVFTGLISLRRNYKNIPKSREIFFYFAGIIFFMGVMQLTTNYVFSKIQVGYGLALFQLSAIVSVLFGWKYFKEKYILKKLLGAAIMVVGAVILILHNV